MNNKIKQQLILFDDLAIRKKILITFSAMILVFFLFDIFWLSDKVKEKKQLNSNITRLEQQVEQLTKTKNEVMFSIKNIQDDPNEKEVGLIKEKIEKARVELENKSISLVKPEEMAVLIEKIIKTSKTLKLVSLNKKIATPLFESNDNSPVEMFRHPLVLNFEGGYMNTMKFIQKLESMEQKLIFDHFVFSVEEYPVSKVSLAVSTLSLSKKWIGG